MKMKAKMKVTCDYYRYIVFTFFSRRIVQGIPNKQQQRIDACIDVLLIWTDKKD
jgi:hypothetical protein